MALRDEATPVAVSTESHRLARLLRHEVGDLLQSVYSTVGILLERLANDLTLERRLLSEMKNRAELCKIELDGVVELVAPMRPKPAPIDLAATLQAVLLQVRRRFPSLQVHCDAIEPALIEADPRTLSSTLTLLLVAACQGAKHQVGVRVEQKEGQVAFSVQRDGYAAAPEQFAWMTEPFATTQHALFGLGLALVHQLAQRSGGNVSVCNRPEGGVSIQIVIPSATP